MNKILLGGAVAAIAFCVAPLSASADTIQSSSQTLIPAQNASCTAIQATDFNAYVYDGAVHSFNFVIPDASYVAVGGSVGEGIVPFWLTSRRVDASGALRIHVDLPTTPVAANLPATITLLSSKPGQPTCVATISMVITPRQGDAGGTTQTPVQTPGTTPVTYTPSGSYVPGNTKPTEQKPTEEAVSSEEAVPAAIPAAITKTQAFVAKMCAFNDGSQVWALLLALYALIVAVALLAPIRSFFGIESWVLRLAIVAIPLGFLIAFWLVAEGCRAGYMSLIASLVLGGAGAYGVYRSQPVIISADKSLMTL